MRTVDVSPTELQDKADWKKDLGCKARGEDAGSLSEHRLRSTAFEVTEAHLLLRDAFRDEELKRIPIVPRGSPLEEGAAYVDLRDPAREQIQATGNMIAEEAHLLVPRSEVDDSTWDRLTHQVPPGQTGG